jgi:uncharacterized protein YuzE
LSGEERTSEARKAYCIDDISFLLVEYDRIGDTLHIIFSKSEPDESILVGDDIVVNLREGKIVSISIPDASRKLGLG